MPCTRCKHPKRATVLAGEKIKQKGKKWKNTMDVHTALRYAVTAVFSVPPKRPVLTGGVFFSGLLTVRSAVTEILKCDSHTASQ